MQESPHRHPSFKTCRGQMIPFICPLIEQSDSAFNQSKFTCKIRVKTRTCNLQFVVVTSVSISHVIFTVAYKGRKFVCLSDFVKPHCWKYFYSFKTFLHVKNISVCKKLFHTCTKYFYSCKTSQTIWQTQNIYDHYLIPYKLIHISRYESSSFKNGMYAFSPNQTRSSPESLAIVYEAHVIYITFTCIDLSLL